MLYQTEIKVPIIDNDVWKRLRNKRELQHRKFALDKNQLCNFSQDIMYESGTSETDPLIVRQQRESVIGDDDDDDDTLRMPTNR